MFLISVQLYSDSMYVPSPYETAKQETDLLLTAEATAHSYKTYSGKDPITVKEGVIKFGPYSSISAVESLAVPEAAATAGGADEEAYVKRIDLEAVNITKGNMNYAMDNGKLYVHYLNNAGA